MKSINRFNEEFEFLSNFYAAPFVWNRRCWPTVEHAFQAAKVPTPDNFQGIITAKTPGDAKRLGRRVALRNDWEKIKVAIMTELVWLKFEYNITLRDKLIDTGSTELVEGNYWHDNFWGICFCDKCRNKKGKNMLGFILMQVREMFQENSPLPNLTNAVSLYIEAKVKMITCMQQHFKQLCTGCTGYALCQTYKNYVDAWINLQDVYNKEKIKCRDGK